VAATRSAHTWPGQATSHADLRAVLRTLVLPVSNRAAAVRGEGGGWPQGHPRKEGDMTEYLIAFNDEWTPDHTDEELREKATAVRALRAEMKDAGVLIFPAASTMLPPCSTSMRRAVRRCSPTVRTSRPRSTSAASPSWMWPTRRRRGCGRERSRWPAVGRRRCDASGSPCNFQRFLNRVGGRSYCEALPRVLVDTTSCFPPDRETSRYALIWFPSVSRARSRRLGVCAGACRRQGRSSGGALHLDGSGASSRRAWSRGRVGFRTGSLRG
jgi:hypothetical protein